MSEKLKQRNHQILKVKKKEFSFFFDWNLEGGQHE